VGEKLFIYFTWPSEVGYQNNTVHSGAVHVSSEVEILDVVTQS